MLLINCDLGERGVAHPIDDKLVEYIDIAISLVAVMQVIKKVLITM